MKRKRLPIEGRNEGIARIHAPDLAHRGMGILVSSRLIVTCAHVVDAARDPTKTVAEDRLTVTFPLIMDTEPFQARIVGGRPVDAQIQADVAVLELVEKDAPAEAGIAVVADIQGVPLDGDGLSTFGFAGQLAFGNHIDIEFMGPAIGGITQINGATPTSSFIEKGYSGAGVWDKLHEVMIGMVSARLKDPTSEARVAYMIPAFALKEAAEPRLTLPVEVRQLPREFRIVWTFGVIGWLLLLLNHFLITQGGSPAPFFSISGDHKQLAAFAGLHVFAFGAPFVYWGLRAHARALSFHDWSWRVPGFSFIRTRTVRRYRRPLSALTLALLVVVPLYAQGHFLRKFHNEGTVYAYARDFGYDPATLKCLPDRQLCEVPGASRYSLAVLRDNAGGGYWDNRYRYGEDHEGPLDTTTFFPILQPVVLEALTALSVLILLSGLNNIFGPWPFFGWLERLFSARKE